MTQINPRPSIPKIGPSNPSKPSAPNVPVVMGQFRVLTEYIHRGGGMAAVDTTEGPVYWWSSYFDVNSAKLLPVYIQGLTEKICLNNLQGLYFDIVARSSRSGSTAHNLGLAARRMLAVQTLLTQCGVPMSMAFAGHHMVVGEEGAALQEKKDGVEDDSERRVNVFAAQSRELLHKWYLADRYVQKYATIFLHRNSALS